MGKDKKDYDGIYSTLNQAIENHIPEFYYNFGFNANHKRVHDIYKNIRSMGYKVNYTVNDNGVQLHVII